VEARTRPVLAEVCRRLGLPSTDATLVRHHTNAVYALGDAVVKIAPPGIGVAQVQPTVAFVEWLTRRGFPTVPLYPGVAQPLEVDGYAVTVWQRLDPAHDNPVTAAELGGLLRQLHALAAPPVPLRPLEPIGSIRRSIVASTILVADDRLLLHSHLDQLAQAWATMSFELPTGLIHADPQAGNALRRPDGCPVLADWDAAATGPREWDLATIAVHCRRFTPDDFDAFDAFSTAYGWDLAGWKHVEDLCRLRELKMIATNARKSRAGTGAAREVHRRIAALRDNPRDTITWHLL